MICNKRLKECLEIFSYYELIEIAKEKGLDIETKFSKREVCEHLARHMLQPEEMERYFSCLFDYEIENLDEGILADMETGKRDGSEKIPELLCHSEYAFRMSEEIEDLELFWMPIDVANAYVHMRSEDFTEKRKIKNHVLSCLIAVRYFYGYVPLSVIAPVMKLSEEKVVDAVESLPTEIDNYMVVDDTLYFRELFSNYFGLIMDQRDIPYYIPDESELKEFGRWGYLPSRTEMRVLVTYLINERKIDEETAESAAMWIQKIVEADAGIEAVYDYLEKFEILKSGERPNELNEILNDFNMKTRKTKNRGFTELELLESDFI